MQKKNVPPRINNIYEVFLFLLKPEVIIFVILCQRHLAPLIFITKVVSI